MTKTEAGIQAMFAADHDRLDGLFEGFRQAKKTDFARAKELFKEFKFGLQRHIVWEEQVLFPLFEKKTGLVNQGPTEVMRREHRQIGAHLEAVHEKVRNQDPGSDREEQALLAALAAHNEKEEKVLYPALDGLLSEAEKASAFTAMEQVPEEAYKVCCGHRQ
jgi:iron-sulfur cluster repair protein YtfE (RIC family)